MAGHVLSQPASPECLQELQRSWRAGPWWWQWLSTLKEGMNPSRCPPLPAQTSSTWPHLPLAAGHIKLLPLSNNSARNNFSRGVHCLAESQTPKQGTVLCDGAGNQPGLGCSVPFGGPMAPPLVLSLPAPSPAWAVSAATSSVPQCPQPRNCTEISCIPLNS